MTTPDYGVTSLTTWRIESMIVAGEAGGLYLDTVGKTDLARLDQKQWMTFIETVCEAYEEKMRAMREEGEPPF